MTNDTPPARPETPGTPGTPNADGTPDTLPARPGPAGAGTRPGSSAAAAARRTRQHGLRGTAGVAAGVVLLAATAALASASSYLVPDPSALQHRAPAVEVPAGDYTAVCPGPPRLLADAGSADPEFSPVSKTAKTRVSAMVLGDLSGTLPGSALYPLGPGDPLTVLSKSPEGESPDAPPASSDEDGLTSRRAGTLGGTAVKAPSVFRAEPHGTQTPVAGAMLSYTAGDGDLRGLAAARCQTPSNDFWILGAATTAGRSSVLILSNPTETPATVDLELRGASGPVDAPGGADQLVPPGKSVQLVLGGLAANQEDLAVRVRSSGGRVAGVIQQSVLRGLTPGGVELLTPTAAASASQVVPGVVLQDAGKARSLRERKGWEDASPEVQVLVPGTSDAVLDIQVFGPDGRKELSGGAVVTAPAGSVSSFALDSLPAGSYTVAVTSDVPVAAAARVILGSTPGKPVDFGGAVSAERVGSDSSVVFAEGVDSALVFGAPAGRSEITLTPVGEGGRLGAEQVISIAGGTSVVVPASALGAGTTAAILNASGDPVFGAQTNTLPRGASGIAVSPIPAGNTGTQSIQVTLGY